MKPLEVYSCDLLVDGKQVAFVVSDHDKNIIIFNYDPEGKKCFPVKIFLLRKIFYIWPLLETMIFLCTKYASLKKGRNCIETTIVMLSSDSCTQHERV